MLQARGWCKCGELEDKGLSKGAAKEWLEKLTAEMDEDKREGIGNPTLRAPAFLFHFSVPAGKEAERMHITQSIIDGTRSFRFTGRFPGPSA